MCGISGWIDFEQSLMTEERALIMSRLSETLTPRGPDSGGEFAEHACRLAHRRLIVIDPENGKQPMRFTAEAQDLVLCYNGELYNTEDIRGELIQNGYFFDGHSDTEVLLKSYHCWGSACLERLNGIFAFAVWDIVRQRLFLARDRIGVKPLFYYLYNGGLIFASEQKALLSHPYIKPEIDRSGIAELTLLGPAHLPSSGVFKGIKQLLPAECTFFDKGGFKPRRYWHLAAKEHRESFAETADHLRFLVTDSIKRQLISDVPLCTFLSGGLDSSIISAVAAAEYRRNGRRLSTFSVDYRGNRENFRASGFQPDEDYPWIMEMSSFLESSHTNVVVDTPELVEALYPAAVAHDLPGMADVDSSLWLFCREVKKRFTVAVSGECADELFAGYPWYHNDSILFGDGFPWSRATESRGKLLKSGILGDINPTEFVSAACKATLSETDYTGDETPREARSREMFMLNFYWFMQVLLSRKDNMSMAHGLEVRVPFCDHRIAEYAYNIPFSMKAFKGREKGLLRHALGGLLPDGVAWRKKSPYPKTHNPDYLRAVTERVREIIQSPDCRITEIFDKFALQTLLETNGAAFTENWFGQLMTAPQIFAYLIQTEHWLKTYDVAIVD